MYFKEFDWSIPARLSENATLRKYFLVASLKTLHCDTEVN